MSLASGSSGNCYYLGDEEGGLLIDAGIPIRTITKTLKAEGITLDSGHIQGTIVTHDHADHIRTIVSSVGSTTSPSMPRLLSIAVSAPVASS